MSGLNPFRPRKSEDIPGRHPLPSTFPTSAASKSTLPAASVNKPLPVTPQSLSRAVDDSASSDDQFGSDPFRQDSYVSDSDDDGDDRNDLRWESSHYPGPRGSPDDRPGVTPHSAPSSHLPTTTSSAWIGKEYPIGSREYYDALRAAAKSNVSVQSLGTTASSSSTDVSQLSSHTGNLTGKPLSTGVDRRPSNKEKKPPPPPKSHHGKLINPSPAASAKSNRFSFHGSTPDTPFSQSSTPSQLKRQSYHPGTDYFSTSENSLRPPDSLRCSQSQYKRPPTPPLSRRHSQMKRSRSTYSNPNISRLSVPSGEEDYSPPSPGVGSSASSVRRNSRSSIVVDDARLPAENINATNSPDKSNATSPNQKFTPIRRASHTSSVTSTAPPPPPPRRGRGSSNHSHDSGRPTSIVADKAGQEAAVHPSNANDILADLSRLQKEVDDLRGHYERRS